ncbi:hypothetical protein [Cryptosporangium sp. NPDC051539]|uniref:hypothetical protein n=1 Tax=Cryptosporangium sp. NPDC051539 TaxID=3363962 RepID=UPI003791616D
MSVQLGQLAAQNGAASVFDRIRTRKATKQHQETIAELEEIVNDLLDDKAQLVRIAQGFEQELVAQRIADSDVEYIIQNVIPVLEEAMRGSEGAAVAQAQIDVIKSILSVETVKVMQLIGFNFRQAIGEPLTTLVSQLILSRAAPSTAQAAELQRMALELQQKLAEISTDDAAFQRYRLLVTG